MTSVAFHKPYGGKKITFINSWAKLKNGMTAETWNALNPRRDRTYDEQRAKAYMAWKTGKEFNGVEWDTDANGVKRVRYVTITTRATSAFDRRRRRYVDVAPETIERIEIPNWDFAAVSEEEGDIFG